MKKEYPYFARSLDIAIQETAKEIREKLINEIITHRNCNGNHKGYTDCLDKICGEIERVCKQKYNKM